MNSDIMTPVDWAKRPVMEKYADFSGRAPRSELWWYFLGLLIVVIVARIIDSILGLDHMIISAYGPLSVLVWLATLVPSLAVGVRRLHDTNRSGWWILLPMVPFCIGLVVGGSALLGAATAGSAAGMMAGAGIAIVFMAVGDIAAIVLLVFYVLPSTPGENRYGANPFGEQAGTIPAE
jgi:uncharacterized membrane protein YhaH (DUF805 family)